MINLLKCLLPCVVVLTGCTANHGTGQIDVVESEPAPETIILDGGALESNKIRYQQGYPLVVHAVRQLIRVADIAADAPAVNVTQKPFTPPSGDKHDYMSMGPYWWPDTTKPDGLPYIRRDGVVNPERWEYDKTRIVAMFEAVYNLALAYHFTGEENYAIQARRHLDAWFFDAGTRMSPNFRFGQFIPGRSEGRAPGIIEARAFLYVLDAVILLGESKSWTRSDDEMIRQWYTEFLEWLRTHPIGLKEGAARNNHGSWYDVQTAAYARFTGQYDLAREILEGVPDRRIREQIEADGSQPEELVRTKSFSYSSFNLHALMVCAKMGDTFGLDIWERDKGVDADLHKALLFLNEHVERNEWPYPQLNEPFWSSAHYMSCLQLAGKAYGLGSYNGLAVKLAESREERNFEKVYFILTTNVYQTSTK